MIYCVNQHYDSLTRIDPQNIPLVEQLESYGAWLPVWSDLHTCSGHWMIWERFMVKKKLFATWLAFYEVLSIMSFYF